LARKWVRHLAEHLPDGVDITLEDKISVEVAALCLNLGRRPFSSCWLEIFKSLMGGHVNPNTSEVSHQVTSRNSAQST
jgi:hypothetical protein